MYYLQNTLLIITMVAFNCAITSAQSLPVKPVVEKLFGKSGQDVINDIIENSKSEIVAVGTSARGANGGEDIYFLVLNEKFNIRQERYIGRNNNDGAYNLSVAPDGRYLVAGYSTMPSGKWRIRERYRGGRDGWLLVLNGNGQTEQEILLGTDGDDEFVKAFALPNGDFLMAGNSGNLAWITRVSPTGQSIWDKKLQYHRLPTHINNAILSIDNQLFVVGYAQDNDNRQMWLAAFDNNGNKQWDKIVPASEALEGTAIILLPNETLGVTGYVKDNRYRENGFFSRIDYNGNQLSYQPLGGREDDRLSNLCLLHNGRIVLVGQSKSFERGSRRDRAWAVVLDKSGSIEGQGFYGSKTTDIGNTILQRSDGSLVMAGFSSQDILRSRQAWLAHITPSRKPPELEERLRIRMDDISQQLQKPTLPGGQSFLYFNLENPNNQGITGLRAVFTPENNAPALTNAVLPPLLSRSARAFYLPITLPANAPSGVYQYQIQLFAGDQPVSEKLQFDLKIGATATAQLKVAVLSSPAELLRGNVQRSVFVVKNTGTVSAKGVNLLLSGPSELRLPATISLGDIAPNESKQYELPHELSTKYPLDSAWMRVRATDVTFQYTDAIELKLPARGEISSVKVDTVSRRDFVTAIWLNPNPDQYDRQEIVWHEEEIIVQVKAVSNKGIEKSHFCLEINGKPCISGAKMDEVALKGTRFSRTFLQKIKLNEGITTLKAVINSEAGRTETDVIRIVYAPRKPNLHLISIGVPAVDLKYTTKDARDFVKAVQGFGKTNAAFQAIFVDTLYTEATTTKTEILKTLRRLQYRFDDRQIAPQDLILIFISSHGLSTGQGEFRIAASDYDGPFLQETSLDFEKEIINYLARINCNKLFFIDACHSGASSQTFTIQASGTSIAEVAAAQKGLNLLMSCRANEYSYEDDLWQNGAFTKILVQAFEYFVQRRSGIDINTDSRLDVKELYEYLQKQVPQLVQTKRPKPQTSQTPLLMLSSTQSQMVLFQLPDKKIENNGKN